MNPVCFILRGLPGAGKSTLAERLAQLYNAEIFSATDYFMVDGVYQYNRLSLPRAHAGCYARFLKAVAFERKNVIVDNTASELWEYKDYVSFVLLNGYDLRIVEIRCDDDATMHQFHGRNILNVPLDTFHRMRERWQPDARAELIFDTDSAIFV